MPIAVKIGIALALAAPTSDQVGVAPGALVRVRIEAKQKEIFSECVDRIVSICKDRELVARFSVALDCGGAGELQVFSGALPGGVPFIRLADDSYEYFWVSGSVDPFLIVEVEGEWYSAPLKLNSEMSVDIVGTVTRAGGPPEVHVRVGELVAEKAQWSRNDVIGVRVTMADNVFGDAWMSSME